MGNWRRSGILTLLLVSLIACCATWWQLAWRTDGVIPAISWTWEDAEKQQVQPVVIDEVELEGKPTEPIKEPIVDDIRDKVAELYAQNDNDVELDKAMGIGKPIESRSDVRLKLHTLMEHVTGNFGKCPGVRSVERNETRVLMINVWTGTDVPNYATHMMDSIAFTDTDRVHLLNIIVSLKDDGCKHFEEVPGQSVVCLTSGQMNFLVADGMCEHWTPGCTDTELLQVVELLNFHVGKSQLGHAVTLRALYGQTFRQYLSDCGYSHWAWVDSDTIFGSWDRLMPWDLLPEFDFVHFSMPGDAECLYVRGQLCIMKVNDFNRNLWSLEKGLQDVNQFLERFGALTSPSPIQYEERGFSAAVLGDERITYLQYPTAARRL